MRETLVKAVFLDYDTVSNGDLDTSALSAAAGDLRLPESDDAKIAERIQMRKSCC
jgi:hypothetical protein